MALWFASKNNRPKRVMAFYHAMICLSLIGRLTIIANILIEINKVDCNKYLDTSWYMIMAKTFGIVFISLKTLSNIPKMMMLRFSAEYKNSGPQLLKCMRFPFIFYILFSNLIDIFSTWVSVSIALSEANIYSVFT